MQENTQLYETVSKYDRQRGTLEDVAIWTKPSTVQNKTILGKAESFIIATARHPEFGDYIFIEAIDENQMVTRLALPPKVSDLIASQRDSLTTRRRRAAAKARADKLTPEDKQVLRDRLAAARSAKRTPRKKRKKRS